MRVLLIEDDPTVSQSLELVLTRANLKVFATDLGEDGVDLAKFYDYDLVILDLGLPDMSGHEVVRQLRLAQIETPILILSGSDDAQSKLKGFGVGADDYVTKPFPHEELIARIHAIIRRTRGHAQPVIRTGALEVHLETKEAAIAGTPLSLSTKEFQILELLSLRKGTTVTKDMIMNHLYGGMDEPEAKIVDVFICKLRKKLAGASGGAPYIQTVWGSGHVLRDPEPDMAPGSGMQAAA